MHQERPMRAANRASQMPRWQNDADVQSKTTLFTMRKKNRETARAKADTAEADFALGPILQEEIFFERFDDVPSDCASDQVRILVSVYKYRGVSLVLSHTY